MAAKKTSTKKFEAPKGAATKEAKAPKPAKKAAEKKEPTVRKASTYRLIAAAKKVWEAYAGQKGAIVKAMVKAGAVGKTAAGVTAAELVKATGIADKNVAFYMSVWQSTKKQDTVIVEKLAAA